MKTSFLKNFTAIFFSLVPKSCLGTIFLLGLGLGAPTYEEATAQDKNETKAAHALYERAMKKKNAPERMAALRAAAARHPLAAELHYGLGREFYQLGQLDSAAARFELVFVLDAALTQRTNLRAILAAAYATLAGQRFNRGKLIPAIEAALAGLQHDANSSSCLATAVVAYQQLGEYERAVNMGLRLIAVQPSAQNYNNLGAAYESKGDWLAAKKYYGEALALAPQLTEAQNNLNRIDSRLEQQTATPAVASKSVAAPGKMENEERKKTFPQEEKPAAGKVSAKTAPNTPALKISNPAPAVAETKPKISVSSPKPEAVDQTKELVPSSPSVSALQTKLVPGPPPKDSTRASAAVKPAKTAAPQNGLNNTSAFWIWATIAMALLALMVWWKFFPHRALENQEPLLTKAPAAPVTVTAVEESLRMLHRVAPASVESDFSKVAAGQSEGNSNNFEEEAKQISLNDKLPDSAAPGNIIAPAAAEAPADPEKNAPPFGLQTEMLFAEMIAGALASFETPEEEGRREAKKEEGRKGEAHEDKDEAHDSVSENGAVFATPSALAEAHPHVNGKALNEILPEPVMPHSRVENVAQASSPADKRSALLPVTERIPEAAAAPMPTPAAGFFALRENFGETRHEKPMEMTTMGFVAGVEEMMREPLESKYLQHQPHEGRAVEATAIATTPASTPIVETARAPATTEIAALAEPRIGRYLIEKEIAKAATGRIYKAWDPKLDRCVVLKTVQYGFAASAQEITALKDRIYREARAIAKLNHPNIVIVYDVDDQPEFSYLVMEYLEGRDLKQVLEAERRMDCGRALLIVMQVCEAMDYAHRAGVFHRDVKPSNIMLLENDETKVTDFGIAKISNYLSLTQTGRVFGTPSYMAPEQIEGQATDGRADLFSLGIVLYELIVGKRPFVADSLAALAYKIVHKQHIPPSLENVELPLELDEVLQRALAKNPAERYSSAAEFYEALVAVKMKLS